MATGSRRPEVLLVLLDPYTHKRFGDTSGTLGDFMASIGFVEALKSASLIITTSITGTNGDLGFPTICFMDTGADHGHKQPWCDDIKGEYRGRTIFTLVSRIVLHGQLTLRRISGSRHFMISTYSSIQEIRSAHKHPRPIRDTQ
jgi:hypothetical protein